MLSDFSSLSWEWEVSSIKELTLAFPCNSDEDPFEKEDENLQDKGSIFPHLRTNRKFRTATKNKNQIIKDNRETGIHMIILMQLFKVGKQKKTTLDP